MPLNPLNSWTVTFTRGLLPHMTLRSAMRFRDYTLRESAGRLRRDQLLALDMKAPFRQTLYLREVGSDTLTFQEVLLDEVYRGVVEHVGGCRTVVDLGANVGLASLYFASHYPGSRVFAVEPNPDTYRVLRLNTEALAREGRCQTFRGAVWGSEAELAAAGDWSSDRFSRFALTESDGGAGEGIKGLPVNKLIEAAGFERVDLLKSDIEGAEVELFKGDLGWLDRVGAVAIEFHGDSRDATRFDEVMRARGFRIIDHGGHTVIAVKPR